MVFSKPKYNASEIKACPIETSNKFGILSAKYFKLGKQIFKNANQPKKFFEIDKPHINGIRFYHNEISNKIDSLILKK